MVVDVTNKSAIDFHRYKTLKDVLMSKMDNTFGRIVTREKSKSN